MVQEINRPATASDFPETAPTANPVFFRTYSRRTEAGDRETWEQVCARSLRGLVALGELSESEAELVGRMQRNLQALPSGRWLWVGGTPWLDKPENFSGAYNCTSTNVIDWRAFGLMMDLAMMGCGTGAVLEPHYIERLPAIRNELSVTVIGTQGDIPANQRQDHTIVTVDGDRVQIRVGDSRQGWVDSYLSVLMLSSDPRFNGSVAITVDISNIRPSGEPLKGFGGVANPIKLPELYDRVAKILDRAIGRQLTSVECCLLIDEAAVTIVAGNIRRSAGMRQFDGNDTLGAAAKDNLWQQDANGNWRIDPDRDALRMANHTRVFHRKPTEEECIAAVQKQFYSGEGAIQWAGEAIARANADLIENFADKQSLLAAYQENQAESWIQSKHPGIDQKELFHRLARIGLNPCGEILGADFHCNLAEIHLNQIDPQDRKTQEDAFTAGALAVASLLNHRFQEPRYQYSREIDPIVGVSFTGLFDFFVQAFGVDWLRWWEAGRPETPQGLAFKEQEREYLSRWRETVHRVVWDYCDRHSLRRPNRCTTVQPAGCLDRSALRIFDQGLLYADEIVAPGSGETIGLDLSVRGGIAAETAIANQPLNLVRVTLANGRVLRMTPNHRLSVSGQWVRADKLRVGMEIDHALGKYQKVEDALLLPLNLRVYDRESRKQQLGHGRGVLTRTIATPTALNPELGYFLGCFYGNGAVSQNAYRIRVAFNAADFGLVERLQQIAERHFGLTGTVYLDPRDRNSRGELTFANKQFFDWMNLNGLAKSKSVELDRIPQAIRRSSRATILSFFCGLIDTDGCVREQGSLSIDAASESFLRNLQQIGEAVGLSFSIFHNTQGRNFQSTKNMWGLCLSQMVSQPAALDYVNTHSRKCALRPLPHPKRHFAFHPYAVAAIEWETSPDYSYDFAVAGVDDDDAWYWQGGLKSHNTKSLLTGSSPGWHPPKAARFIRRITFRKNDPVALACMDYGYSVVPSQSDKDEQGNLLNDPFDPRCSEWLVEIPVAVTWADLPGADTIAIEKFSALAQFDFYMQVQRYYTAHNTSATIELREEEIEALGKRIHQAIANDEGYMSAALLSRFDAPFPRLPFEKIDRETYDRLYAEVLARRKTDHFSQALQRYDRGEMIEAGPAGCDSDKCLLPETK